MRRFADLSLHLVRLTIAARVVAVCAAALGAILLAGCADVITYSHDAERAGMKQYEAGDYGDAAGSFRDSVRQDARNYKAFYYLGASYEKLGSLHQAAQSYETALKVMDRSLSGKEDKPFRGQIIDSMGRVLAASENHTAEVPTLPDDPKHPAEGAWLRAKIQRYSGDADGAIDAYNDASVRDPKNFYLVKDYGLYLEELGLPQRADPVLRKAYALGPVDEQVVAALRRIGVVPGPSLREESDLAKPLIPKGPIPEVDLKRLRGGSKSSSSTPAPAPATGPRD